MTDIDNVISGLFSGRCVVIPDGATRLFILSLRGRTEDVRRRIAAGDNPNERSFTNGNIKMTEVPAVVRTIVTRAVIQQQENPGMRIFMPENGFDNLYFPVNNRDYETVKVLLDAGANPNAKSLNGLFPLYIAAETGELKNVKQLVEHGANLNMTSPRSWTPLINAADEGHYEVVKYLLEKGADASIRNSEGMTACDIARSKGFYSIASLLF